MSLGRFVPTRLVRDIDGGLHVDEIMVHSNTNEQSEGIVRARLSPELETRLADLERRIEELERREYHRETLALEAGEYNDDEEEPRT